MPICWDTKEWYSPNNWRLFICSRIIMFLLSIVSGFSLPLFLKLHISVNKRCKNNFFQQDIFFLKCPKKTKQNQKITEYFIDIFPMKFKSRLKTYQTENKIESISFCEITWQKQSRFIVIKLLNWVPGDSTK